jgi:hypothetical protein
MAQSAQNQSGNGQSGELVCPECGRTFTRAAAMGAHRRRAHGVAGTSRAAAANRGSSGRRRGRPPANGRRRRASTSAGSSSGGVDRNRLLQALFPGGVPPREDVIRALAAWLDEGERLAKMR